MINKRTPFGVMVSAEQPVSHLSAVQSIERGVPKRVKVIEVRDGHARERALAGFSK